MPRAAPVFRVASRDRNGSDGGARRYDADDRGRRRSRKREEMRFERLRAGEPTSVGLSVDELLELVDGLPYRQKTVLVLRYYLDQSEAEIADVLGCRPGTVKSLAARGLDQLRKVIGE